MSKETNQARQAVFRQWYDRYYQAVYHTALGILHNAAEAEDCEQETFVALWNALQTGADIHNPGGWLLRVCRNASLNALRRDRRVVAIEEMEERPLPDPSAGVMPEEAVYIAQILACLPALERDIFTLHVTAGLRLTEIAHMLEMPAATVRWRYATARKLLQQQLKKEGDIA